MGFLKRLIKNRIKTTIRSIGYDISKITVKEVNHLDPFIIQQNLLKDNSDQKIIFDVGAYIGTISKKYNTIFPKSNIYAFEPFKKSYEMLNKNLSSFKNITAINKALGKNDEYLKFHINGFAPTNSLLK